MTNVFGRGFDSRQLHFFFFEMRYLQLLRLTLFTTRYQKRILNICFKSNESELNAEFKDRFHSLFRSDILECD